MRGARKYGRLQEKAALVFATAAQAPLLSSRLYFLGPDVREGKGLHTHTKEKVYPSLIDSLSHAMDCSLPGSSVHRILQAKIFVWVVISFSRGSSCPSSQTPVSCTAGRFFTIWATREAPCYVGAHQKQVAVLKCFWRMEVKGSSPNE